MRERTLAQPPFGVASLFLLGGRCKELHFLGKTLHVNTSGTAAVLMLALPSYASPQLRLGRAEVLLVKAQSR